jgi:hypothetical protein
LNFGSLLPLSPNCLSLSSLFWRFVSHLSTNQAWPCLAFKTRRDWASSGWYGRTLKIFIDWSFFSSLWGFVFNWILFGWSWSHMGGWGENNKKIRWESVPTRPFWPNLSNQEA